MVDMFFCQSCGMALDTEVVKGTEKDGSKSNEYCRCCYENGAFNNPKMTLEEMKEVVKAQLGSMHSHFLIEKEVDILSNLKRWEQRPLIYYKLNYNRNSARNG